MNKFKKGDRVKVVGSTRLRNWHGWERAVGWTTTVNTEAQAELLNTGKETCLGDNRYSINFSANSLIKIGGSISKYEDLKQRIEAVTAWDKEADDMLEEMGEGYSLRILAGTDYEMYNPSITIWTRVLNHQYSNSLMVAEFGYTTQCGKLVAFKKALMWLLDRSNVKKEDSERLAEIKELQRQIHDAQTRLDKLK